MSESEQSSIDQKNPESRDPQSVTPENSSEELQQRIDKLKKMPVTISVRLAEKRIELEHLLEISPGALLTFNKSCEDLLDLYVNNVLYCRGEAVKIGEKFGLKINDLRPVEENEPSVLYS